MKLIGIFILLVSLHGNAKVNLNIQTLGYLRTPDTPHYGRGAQVELQGPQGLTVEGDMGNCQTEVGSSGRIVNHLEGGKVLLVQFENPQNPNVPCIISFVSNELFPAKTLKDKTCMKGNFDSHSNVWACQNSASGRYERLTSENSPLFGTRIVLLNGGHIEPSAFTNGFCSDTPEESCLDESFSGNAESD